MQLTRYGDPWIRREHLEANSGGAVAYSKPLPSIRGLRKLASRDGPFPAKSSHIVSDAERYGFDDNMLAFLKLFSRDEVFHSREDFLERCGELELLICSERGIPAEVLHGPQD